MPYDISAAFRHTNIVPTTSNGLPASSNASAMIRNQLNMSAIQPTFNYNMIPSAGTVKAPGGTSLVRKRRQSTAKKSLQSANMEQMYSLQNRYNGALVRPGDDILVSKNGSAHLAILPDGDASSLRSSPSQIKNSSNGNRSVVSSRMNRVQTAPFNVPTASNQPRKTPPTSDTSKVQSTNPNSNMLQRITNAISSAFSGSSTPKTAPAVPRGSPLAMPRVSPLTNSTVTPHRTPSTSSPASMSRSLTSAALPLTSSSVAQRSPSSINLTQRPLTSNLSQRPSPSANLSQRPTPSANLSQRPTSSANPSRPTPSTNMSHRSSSFTANTSPRSSTSTTNLSHRSASSLSLNAAQRTSSTASQSQSPRGFSAKNVNPINDATTIKPIQRPANNARLQTISKSAVKASYTPQNRSNSIQPVVPRNAMPKAAASQNVIPQKEAAPRVQIVPQIKKPTPLNSSQLQPQKRLVNPAQIAAKASQKDGTKGQVYKVSPTVPKTNPTPSNLPISITKLNVATTSARPEMRPQLSQVMPSGITVHKLPPQASRSSSQVVPTPQVNRPSISLKRPMEVRDLVSDSS